MRQTVPPRHRVFARAMRKEATPAENRLWQALRGRQLGGLKFKRQVPLDGYIVDLVCFETRLIIEIDGGQHAQSARDMVRDHHFQGQGFTTLRFWNDEIIMDIDAVCRSILAAAGRPS